MKKTVHRFKTADETEAAFYAAFMRGDADMMAGVWASEEALCVHPGSGAIVNHQSVVRSWANIFSGSRHTELNYTVARRTESDDIAVHVVTEEIFAAGAVAAVVLATNVYRKFGSGWLMIEHHASLVQGRTGGRTLQ